MSHSLSLSWHWSLGETYFLLVKSFSKEVPYQLQMKGQELAGISHRHQCLFYTLYTPGESWNTRETTSTSLVTRGVPRASLGLFKNWHFIKKSQTTGIKYFLLCLLQTGKRPFSFIWFVCAEVHNGESKDQRGDSSQHYSASHNYQTMIISEKEIPFI